AVVADGRVRSNVVSSQAELHARFGGVVPEVASRRHLELVSYVVRDALDEADARLDDVELVAVTTGPGLIGALLVGVAAAKGIAFGRRLPLASVDHLHGHVAALYLDPQPPATSPPRSSSGAAPTSPRATSARSSARSSSGRSRPPRRPEPGGSPSSAASRRTRSSARRCPAPHSRRSRSAPTTRR